MDWDPRISTIIVSESKEAKYVITAYLGPKDHAPDQLTSQESEDEFKSFISKRDSQHRKFRVILDEIFAAYEECYGAPIWRKELSKDVKERMKLAKEKKKASQNPKVLHSGRKNLRYTRNIE